MFILKTPWNFSSSSSVFPCKWQNIPNPVSLCLSGAPTLCLLWCHLLLHIIVCKTSMLKFSIVLELFVHCSKSTKNPLELAQTWLDSTQLRWCVRTLKHETGNTIPLYKLQNSANLFECGYKKWKCRHYYPFKEKSSAMAALVLHKEILFFIFISRSRNVEDKPLVCSSPLCYLKYSRKLCMVQSIHS
jgi:hypothetical protein